MCSSTMNLSPAQWDVQDDVFQLLNTEARNNTCASLLQACISWDGIHMCVHVKLSINSDNIAQSSQASALDSTRPTANP